jgi:hypothetical protein
MLDSSSEKLASIDAVFGALPAPEKAVRGFVEGLLARTAYRVPASISHVNHVHLAAYSMCIDACYRKHACIALARPANGQVLVSSGSASRLNLDVHACTRMKTHA